MAEIGAGASPGCLVTLSGVEGFLTISEFTIYDLRFTIYVYFDILKSPPANAKSHIRRAGVFLVRYSLVY
jgi:hypothetical protein